MASTDYDRDRYGNDAYGYDRYGSGSSEGWEGYGHPERPEGLHRSHYGQEDWRQRPGQYNDEFGYGGSGTFGRSANYGNYGNDRDQGNFGGSRGSSRSWDDYGSQEMSGGPSWSNAQSWQIPGPFSGVGPQGYQRSDERIREEVCDRLTQHGQLDASNLMVQVAQGEVTLSGAVDNRQARRMAEETAESVPGVQNIRNEIKVQQGLLEKIKDALTPGEPSRQQTTTH